MFGQQLVDRLGVEWLTLHPVVIMSTGHPGDDDITKGRTDPRPLHHGIVEANEDRKHRTSVALDHRVRGQRGRDRHEAHRRRVESVTDRSECVRHTNRQVATCGERLCRRTDQSGFGVEEDSVGVGAAGIHTEEKGRACGHSAPACQT